MNPANQKFTKLDIAKVEHTWAGLPHIVCLGGEKNFKAYLNFLEINGSPEANVQFFKGLIAKILVFRAVERIVSDQPWYGGYRANIVPYTIAKMNALRGWDFDLEAVWLNQDLSRYAADQAASVAEVVWEVLDNPPQSVRNIGEWSKKYDCWAAVLEAPVD